MLETSPTFNNQLRHAVRLYSKHLAGVLLLIDTFKWIEVYYTGKPCYCHIVRDVIKSAITTCAQPLSYNEAALDYDIGLLCRHDKCKCSGEIPKHPAIVDLPQDGRALCYVNKELTFDLDLNRELSWYEKTDSEGNIIYLFGSHVNHICLLLYCCDIPRQQIKFNTSIDTITK